MQRNRYLVLAVISVLMLSFLVIACEKEFYEEPQHILGKFFGGNWRNITDGAFHLATGGEPISCDPQMMSTVVENHTVPQTCEGLLSWGPKGPNGDPVPGLAARYTVSDDSKVYTFYLRPGLKWSNGQKLTAYDLEYSWIRGSGEGFLYNLVFKEGQVAKWEATADDVFVVTLKSPNRIFLTVLPLPVMCAVHQPTIEKYGDGWCSPKRFVGSGAYMPVKVKLGEYIRFKKNPYYWDADNVSIERVVAHISGNKQLIIDLYKQGKIDFTGAQTVIPYEYLLPFKDPENPEGYTVDDVYRFPIMANSYLTFNHGRKELQDPRVREAFNKAINRQKIIDNVIKGSEIPMANFIPPGMGYDLIDYPVDQDCAEAQKLMAAAGYPGGKNFPRFRFLFRTDSLEPDWVPTLVRQITECLGIEFSMESMPMLLWRPKYSAHNFDVTVDGWNGDYSHPHTFVGLLHSKSSMNNSGYNSAEMDAALDAALLATTPEEYQAAYRVVDQLILDEMVMVNLWFRGWTLALRPEWEGWQHNILNTYLWKNLQRVEPSPAAEEPPAK